MSTADSEVVLLFSFANLNQAIAMDDVWVSKIHCQEANIYVQRTLKL